MTNQDYLLIIDCRDETTFLDQHVLTARWYGLISADEITTALTRHMHIVLYDEDGSGIDEDQSPINKLFDKLQVTAPENIQTRTPLKAGTGDNQTLDLKK